MFELYDVIKVSKDLEDDIKAGDIGTIVHIHDTNPPAYMIELTDDEGRTIATPSLQVEEMKLYWSAKTQDYVDDF